jgi:membrane-associated phospholipid phosphatase
MNAIADLLGAHAVAALLAIAVVMLLFTALAWHVIQKYSAALRRLLAALLDRTRTLVNSHAPGVSMPSVLVRTAAIARYLGVQAVISFAVCVAAFAVFFEIADEIGADEDLAQVDVMLSDALKTHVSPGTLLLFSRITRLGDSTFLAVLATVIALILLWRRQWLHAGAWIVATSLGAVLNRVLKALFERSRPEHDHLMVTVSGWSFPSGHASGSFIVYGLLGYLLVRHTPPLWHVPAVMLAVLLIVFVGFSRVILQVHYLSDVLAGYAFAAAWVTMWIAGLEGARSSPADPSASRCPPA